MKKSYISLTDFIHYSLITMIFTPNTYTQIIMISYASYHNWHKSISDNVPPSLVHFPMIFFACLKMEHILFHHFCSLCHPSLSFSAGSLSSSLSSLFHSGFSPFIVLGGSAVEETTIPSASAQGLSSPLSTKHITTE